MKDLTYEELLKAPTKVQFLYLRSMYNQPVGNQMFEEAMKENPEYFPDELARRRKWDLIPQSVHDCYWKEIEALHREIYDKMPPSKGIIGWIKDGDVNGYANWNKEYKRLRKIEQPLAESIHKKYYKEYGIEYNGW